MSVTRIFIGVYWGARRETVSECSLRLQKHFHALSKFSSKLSHWATLAGKKPKTPNYVDTTDEETLRAILQRGVNRRDVDNGVIPDLGYRITLWNGDNASPAKSSVKCGLYSKHPGLSNSATLDMELSDNALVEPHKLEDLILNLTDIWQGENGRVVLTLQNVLTKEYSEMEYLQFSTKQLLGKEAETVGRLWVAKNTSIDFLEA